jgi:DNA-binding SARP family transcriptional activator/TolB-like protein
VGDWDLSVVSASAAPAPQSYAGGSQGRLCVTVLGAFAASIGGAAIHLPTRKVQALLAYLALGDAAGATREAVGALLWSESDGKRSRNSLRHVVKELNDALSAAGSGGFHPGRLNLTLARSHIATDVDTVLDWAARGHVHPRLLDTQCLADTLLAGLETVDPAFQVWVRTKRHALHDRLNTMLGSALAGADAARGEGADIARALHNLDPTHEAACRHLMHLYAARGEIGTALKVYKTLWDLLEDEYGTEPSQDTQDLVVQIKQQTGWSARPGDAPDPTLACNAVPAAAPSPAAHQPRLVITVEAFHLAGVPESLRATINGFRHELVTSLARFREWSVRTLAARPDTVVPADPSSTEYILDATACCGHDGTRLIASLADGEGNVVWGDRFTLRTASLLASQQAIVRAIAVALKINLSADRQRRMGETSLDAVLHDAWLRGQNLMHGLNPKDWRTAEALLRDLMRRAPNFSPVISSMVQLRNSKHIVFPGEFRSAEAHAATLQLAQRAVQLDPQDSRAQLCVAWAHQLVGRFEGARSHAELAIELNPCDPWTLMATAQILAYCGSYDKAVELCGQSLALAPNPTPTQRRYASAILFLSGRYRQAVEAAPDGLDPSPAFSVWPCASLVQLGQARQAARLLQRAVSAIRAEWAAPLPRDDRTIYRWLLHTFPMAVEADWERLRRCLAKAGGLVDEERFEGWRQQPPVGRLVRVAS